MSRQSARDEFNDLWPKYNEEVGEDGNKFLYSENPSGKGKKYVFRDRVETGIHQAIAYMYEQLAELRAERAKTEAGSQEAL